MIFVTESPECSRPPIPGAGPDGEHRIQGTGAQQRIGSGIQSGRGHGQGVPEGRERVLGGGQGISPGGNARNAVVSAGVGQGLDRGGFAENGRRHVIDGHQRNGYPGNGQVTLGQDAARHHPGFGGGTGAFGLATGEQAAGKRGEQDGRNGLGMLIGSALPRSC